MAMHNLRQRALRRIWQESLGPHVRDYLIPHRIGGIHSEAVARKSKQAPLQERKMVDRFRICVRGGKGGSGCASFRRSRHSRYGVADGGNGGKGGSVILECSAAVWDFSNLQHHVNADQGGQGSSKKRVGNRGSDKVVQVPVGTVIHLANGSLPVKANPTTLPDPAAWPDVEGTESEETGVCTENCEEQLDGALGSPAEVAHILESSVTNLGLANSCAVYDSDISSTAEHDWSDDISFEDESHRRPANSLIESNVAELVSPGKSFVVASGGEGGRGNTAFARGCGRKKALPSRDRKPGQPGSEAVLILELKTIADVGLVGVPNAGKSTLLGAMSRAKPMVGHYAFTTLRPNIGKVTFEDFFSLTVADIPGLLHGAHQNKGLGFAFLRHIERTKALVYVLDLSAALGDNKGIPPWDQYEQLKYELEQYQAGLSDRPSLVVANKIDEDGTVEVLKELTKRLPVVDIYPVCAVLEQGIGALKLGLRMLVNNPTLHASSLSHLRM